MAALQDILDEQARIRQELQRMEDSDETTEENDGDFRDTLVARWEELDKASKPIIERMERIKAITRVAEDEANLERPDGNGEPDEHDEALPPDEAAAAGSPLTRADGDEVQHEARYHQHALYSLRSREAREKAGLVW